MTNEQRLQEIRERQRRKPQRDLDIDFLLGLVDRRLAHNKQSPSPCEWCKRVPESNGPSLRCTNMACPVSHAGWISVFMWSTSRAPLSPKGATIYSRCNEPRAEANAATLMRSACIETVKAMGQRWYADAKKRGAAFSDKGRLAETIAKKLESVTIQEQKS